MTTPLQTAAQAVIARWESPKWKDEAPTAVVIDALRKALATEQAAAAPTLTETLAAHGVKLRTEFEPKERDHVESNLHMVCERAELIAGLIRKADAWDYLNPEAKRPNVCRQAAGVLEADGKAQQVAVPQKIGDSRFESWYGETKIQQMGTKQRYREAYEAGMNEAQQGLSIDLLERLSKTLINLGYSTPEGGMEHFGARIESQLYNLCRGVDAILAQQVAVPDMFWNHDDADKLYSSISEFLNDEICNGTELAVGDIRTVQRALRLPNIDIRITSVDEDECDADYEIVEVQGAKP